LQSVNYTGASKTETPKNPSRISSQGGKPPLSDSGDAGSKILNQNNPPSSSSTSTTSSTTPNRSVTRSLRYGATPSSAVSVSSSARGGGGGAGKSMVEQQLDIEENPTFWKDHNVQVGECVDVLRFFSFLILVGVTSLLASLHRISRISWNIRRHASLTFCHKKSNRSTL
jgi:hypothetical protein